RCIKNVNNNLLLGYARFEFSDKDIKDLKGSVSGHAYSILLAAETDDGIKLLQIRNPWEQLNDWYVDSIKNAWSDGSKEWIPESMIQLNHRFGDDGTFWVCYDDFLNYWDMIDKCRLFDSSWTVYMTWINYNVVSRSKGKFKLSLPEEYHLIIVLQQPNNRYFCNEPKYDETSSYLARSRSTFAFASRSINHEVKLPAGDYVIIPHVDRETIDRTEENQEPKQEKDSEIEAKKHKKDDEKGEEKDPEVDTKVINPKDDEKKDDEKKDDEKKDNEKKDDEKRINEKNDQIII
ncbi:1129_t:CDS:2, partial [Racocetra persica]